MTPLDPNDPRVAAARKDAEVWDELVEGLGVVIGQLGWGVDGKALLGFERPFGPHKLASPRCRSGRRNYCTCSTCF